MFSLILVEKRIGSCNTYILSDIIYNTMYIYSLVLYIIQCIYIYIYIYFLILYIIQCIYIILYSLILYNIKEYNIIFIHYNVYIYSDIIYITCDTIPICSLIHCGLSSFSFMSPIRICPLSISYSLSKRDAMVDLPEPLAPTTAVTSPIKLH